MEVWSERMARADNADTPSKPPLHSIAAALRRAREDAGLSLTELARRAGVAKSTLSQLEAGRGNPSLETLWTLCTALDLPFSRLLSPPRARVQVIRAGQGATVASSQADYRATLLSACPPGARRDLYHIEVEPGTPRISDPHSPGVVEHVLLASGRALVGPSDDPAELHPGDFVTYPADQPHIFEALDPATRALLASDHI
jgi:transcriptional regulator with XRE-family HTH domain